MKSKQMRRWWLFLSVVVMGMTIPACSLPGTGSATNSLEQSLALSQSTYLVLNITSGTIEGFSSLPDLTTNVSYRSTSMVFHRIAGDGAIQGAVTGMLGDGVDPAASNPNLPNYYIGTFEVTQAQWQLLDAGSTPWTTASVLPNGGAGTLTTNADHPAYGLSRELVDTALQTYLAGRPFSLIVPTDSQWEHACRAGTATPFYWGSNAGSRSEALPYAYVAETRTALGPIEVAQRQANAFGLYDIQGNVWELTHTGNNTALRGGSWYEPMSMARSSHVLSIDRGTAHVLAGVRLVLVP
jgi:Sulfatase-modifying factor enzyme 1